MKIRAYNDRGTAASFDTLSDARAYLTDLGHHAGADYVNDDDEHIYEYWRSAAAAEMEQACTSDAYIVTYGGDQVA